MDSYWQNFPFHFDDESVSMASHSSGISVYEEGDKVVVEAALPGVAVEDIEVSHTHGFLLVEGEKKEDETKRNYFRAGSTRRYYSTQPAFCYVAHPGRFLCSYRCICTRPINHYRYRNRRYSH